MGADSVYVMPDVMGVPHLEIRTEPEFYYHGEWISQSRAEALIEEYHEGVALPETVDTT